ncbi:hypothetical protein LAZ67_3004252 [Cordylochernes scorpioides]|uniref:Integrase catalytic domain-containing protein n=1 Tax=Cordylochernes scorpioides TaxID=51811 RepID=A0ABY6K9B6_9ARAC|nr:hypothetical protein LAZ67_3004252 [Cordylochernes scorpioides]
MRRAAAKFVPKLLNCDQKQHRMNIANEMLDSVRDDPNFLQRVITGDEAWVYGYDVETKAHSSQWGVVHHEFLPQGRTVNKEYYLQVIRNLREAIRQKRPDLWKNKNWLLHHDNAPAHTSLLVRDFLAKNNTLIMPQPPYSPDLAPCDFFLFPKLKRPMKGRRYATLDEIKTASKEELNKIDKMDQKSGETISKYIIRLKEQAQRCNFGDFLQESLRDRFVAGIIDTSTQKKLLQEEGLTFEGALDIALSAESADNDLHNIKRSENAHQSPQHLHAINNACKHCGKTNHLHYNCFFKSATCRVYGRADFIPKFYKFRQVPFALKQLVENEIDKLVDLNILSPIDKSDCASPLVCVAKPNGQIRLCADFKKSLNPYLEDVKYPIPNIDSVLSNFQGKKLFTKLDLSKAYHQIEMDDISKKYLVVSTHKGPWRRVHMDYFNFKNKLFLLAVDSFSSWVEVSEVPSTSAYFCINFMRNCIARYGFPQVVVSDNGPPFFSSDFGDFLSKNGISHVTSPPYHPKSNGQAEVSVREVKKLLKKQLYENEQVELDLALSRALFFIRTDVNIRKGTSPAEMFLGRKIRSRLSVLSKEEVKVSKVNGQYVNSKFKVDETVKFRWITNGHPSWYTGKIIKILGRNVYLIKQGDSIKKVHKNYIKKMLPGKSHPTNMNDAERVPTPISEEKSVTTPRSDLLHGQDTTTSVGRYCNQGALTDLIYSMDKTPPPQLAGEEIEGKETTGIHKRSKTMDWTTRGDEEDGGGSMERSCGPPSVEEGIEGGRYERPCGPPSVEEGIEGGRYRETMWPTLSRGRH